MLPVTPESGTRAETNMSRTMAATGLHGVLDKMSTKDGVELAMKPDELLLRNTSEFARDAAALITRAFWKVSRQHDGERVGHAAANWSRRSAPFDVAGDIGQAQPLCSSARQAGTGVRRTGSWGTACRHDGLAQLPHASMFPGPELKVWYLTFVLHFPEPETRDA